MVRISQEEISIWFKDLEGHSRIELMCALFDSCLPLELRFLGTYLEYAAGKHFTHLQKWERDANSKNTLYFNNLSDTKTRRRLCIFLALLHSHNKTVAAKLFNILNEYSLDKETTHASGLGATTCNNSESENSETIEDKSDWTDTTTRNEMKLLLTMASLHPAFAFHQRLTIREKMSDFTSNEYIQEDCSSECQEGNLIDFETLCDCRVPERCNSTDDIPKITLAQDIVSMQKVPLLPSSSIHMPEVYPVSNNYPYPVQMPVQNFPMFLQRSPVPFVSPTKPMDGLYQPMNNPKQFVYIPVGPRVPPNPPSSNSSTVLNPGFSPQQQFKVNATRLKNHTNFDNSHMNNNNEMINPICIPQETNNASQNIGVSLDIASKNCQQNMDEFPTPPLPAMNIHCQETMGLPYIHNPAAPMILYSQLLGGTNFNGVNTNFLVNSSATTSVMLDKNRLHTGVNGMAHSFSDPAIVSSKVLPCISPDIIRSNFHGTPVSIHDTLNVTMNFPESPPHSPLVSPRLSPCHSPVHFQKNSLINPLSSAHWLKSLRLHKYYSKLQQYSFKEMKDLGDEELDDLGLTKGARARFLQNIEVLRKQGFEEFAESTTVESPPHDVTGANTCKSVSTATTTTSFSVLSHVNTSDSALNDGEGPVDELLADALKRHGEEVCQEVLSTSRQSTVTCYNCGTVGHYGDECTEQTMESQTYSRYAFRLDYSRHSSDVIATSPETYDESLASR